MNFKKLLLVTFLLIAILSISAVNASQDINDFSKDYAVSDSIESSDLVLGDTIGDLDDDLDDDEDDWSDDDYDDDLDDDEDDWSDDDYDVHWYDDIIKVVDKPIAVYVDTDMFEPNEGYVSREYGNKIFSNVNDTVVANDFTKMFKNGTQYNGTFYDSQGNLLKDTQVSLEVNGVSYDRTTDENGVAYLNINLNPGEYVLTATNPSTGGIHTTRIIVLPTIVEAHNLTKYYRNDSQYTVRILGDDGKPVGAVVNVTFNIGGMIYSRTTNESGYVELNINLNPGEYIVTAEYNGLKASNTIKVLPILDLSWGYDGGLKFEAKVLDGQGKPYANQKVSFNINGILYYRYTDSNGISLLKINLQPGDYIITSTFNELNVADKVTVSS